MNYGNLGGQPILVLPEGVLRKTGKDAQKSNIAAARAVAEAVRTTLGPRGMDKMLVDSIGDVVITNDGATILDEMEIEHPAAKMMVEVAKTQEQEAGDGTTTAVVLAGELLRKAEEMMDQNIHPTIISAGYRIAKKKAVEVLEKIGKDVTLEDDEILKKMAMTTMTGKGSEGASEKLAELVVKAIKQVAANENGVLSIDKDDIKIEKKQGGSGDDTELIHGIVIDKELVHPHMPKKIENAKVLLLNYALEVKETENDAKIEISSPEQLQAFLDKETEMLKEMANKIEKLGANVVFCQKGIDDLVQHYLAKKGIAAVRRVKKSDMEKLAKATGARIVMNLDDATPEDLGEAGLVQEKKVGGEAMVFVEKCKDPKAVTILIRGGTEHVVDELERAVEDAVTGLIGALEVGKTVAGGGATEVEVAKELRDYAESVGGKEQLAIQAFADALEIIPKTLAESAGMDSVDVLVELRSEHDRGNKTVGVDVMDRKIGDMWEKGVLESLKIKTQAIKSATEAVEMILRIDDVITASKLSDKSSGNDFKGGDEFE